MPPSTPKASPKTKSAKSPKASAPKPKATATANRPSAEIRRVAELLKQVSDPTRLQVLTLLNEKERNVSELCEALGAQSQPAVSHHLALLRHGGIIAPRRQGKNNFYALTEIGDELASVVKSVIG